MNNLDKQYQKLLQEILDTGVSSVDRTGTGTLSVFGVQIRHKMSEGFPLLTTKKVYWKGILAELVWFLRGDTNIKYLVDNNCHIWDGDAYKSYVKYWEPNIEYIDGKAILTKEEFINKIKTDDEFAEKWGELGPIYGKQWRRWGISNKVPVGWDHGMPTTFEEQGGIDQIVNLIKELKANPDSRRLMVNSWNVSDLYSMTLPPCHYGFQVYTRELSLKERRLLVTQEMFNQIYNGGGPESLSHKEIDKWNVPTRAISLMWNQRSVDTLLGLPFNIASYGLLLEVIAKAVNMIPDELIGSLGNTHLYSNHIEQAREQIKRESFELPKLNINTEFWPTESGECGVGLIDALALFNGFFNDNFCKSFMEEDIQLSDYKSHPPIKAPLSN